MFDNGFIGGVHTARTPGEARHIASQMLGHRLVTKQSGPEGKPCNSVMVAKRYHVEAEKYLCLLLDRHIGTPVLLSSPAGGVDVEDTLHHTPDLVHKQVVDPVRGPTDDELAAVVARLGLPADVQLHHQARTLLRRLYDMFAHSDALQIEINPLAVASSSAAATTLLPLDLKVEIDDNAAFRQPQLAQQQDWSQLDPREAQAQQRGLSFVALDGDIGSIVNGAGLSMATMDLLHQHGGRPSNFLDLGGGSTQQHMELALHILSSDPSVRVIFVNIFGAHTELRRYSARPARLPAPLRHQAEADRGAARGNERGGGDAAAGGEWVEGGGCASYGHGSFSCGAHGGDSEVGGVG